jgi:hypothetical protein
VPETHFRYLLAQHAEIVAEVITEQGTVGRYSVVLLTREEAPPPGCSSAMGRRTTRRSPFAGDRP